MAMTEDKLITTIEAAELLNVRHSYLITLLDEGQIPSQGFGSTRRVKVSDALAYREARDREREEALARIIRKSEEADLPY